jgi:hypothetical protein
MRCLGRNGTDGGLKESTFNRAIQDLVASSHVPDDGVRPADD